MRDIFAKKNWILLDKKYINHHVPLKVQCPEGHITKKRLTDFLSNSGCFICYHIWHRGKNNHSWNKNLTNADRVARRMLRKNYSWISKVFKKDNYKCQCCGDNKGGNLNAHHLESYHWCKDLRFEVSNGVTLCEKCHTKFHTLFGWMWNTSEQFYIFLRNNND